MILYLIFTVNVIGSEARRRRDEEDFDRMLMSDYY
jgi:ABC-type transport system involved in Fe-S cluster assembly fused permease/ATPase subunit